MGGVGLWTVGFYEGVKDRVGKYSTAVSQSVILGVFGMNVKTFDCVEVSTFLLVV